MNPVTLKVDDGFDSGLTLDDACAFAKELEAAGVDMIVPSCGFVDRNGFHMLRGPVLGLVISLPTQTCVRGCN